MLCHNCCLFRYLGLASSAYQTTLTSPKINFKSKCSKIAVFAPRQREICTKSKNVLDIISKGASMGIEECKNQFIDRRWNCTTFNTTSVFGKVLQKSKSSVLHLFSYCSVLSYCSIPWHNFCSGKIFITMLQLIEISLYSQFSFHIEICDHCLLV